MSLRNRGGKALPSAESKDGGGRSLFVHEPKDASSANRRQSVAPEPKWTALFAFTNRNHYVALSLAGGLSVASGIVNPALAIFLGKVFDKFSAFGAGNLEAAELLHDISHYAVILLGLGVASWTLNALFFASWLGFGELQAKGAQQSVFTGLASRPISWYDLRRSGIGALIPRLQTQIRELQMSTSQPLGYVLQYLIASIASLGVAFYYSWSLTLVIIASVPVSAVILSWISNRMQPSIDGQTDELANAGKISNTAFGNIITVKCFNGQHIEASKFAHCISAAASWYFKQARTNSLQIGVVRIITFGMFVQGFWFGHHLVATGKTTFGNVVTCFWTCLTATQSVEQILPQMLVLEKGKAAGAALSHLVGASTSSAQVSGPNTQPSFCQGQILLRGVSFAYPARPDYTVLKNFNGMFVAGETTFLIGQSGSGKSTISQILMRFYDQTSGSILFDGQRLEALSAEWLRQNVTLVEQTSVLFSGTIKDNIALGKPESDVTTEQVKEAVQFALLEQTMSELPKGLDTKVTGKGSSLSGGQKQRVAIARARLRDTPILILDESTSALDQTSRTLVMAAIRRWRQGKTNIVITHDLSQIEPTDHVYVLENGKVIKTGYGNNLADINPSPSVSRPSSPARKKKDEPLNPFAKKGTRTGHGTSSRLDPDSSAARSERYDSTDRLFGDSSQSMKSKKASRKSYIPSIYGGASVTAVPGATQAVGSFMHHQSTSPRPMSFRRPTIQGPRRTKAPPLPPLPAGIAEEASPPVLSPAKEARKRMTKIGTELMELTGMKALEARANVANRRRMRPESIQVMNQQVETPATNVMDMDLERRATPAARKILRTVWSKLTSKQKVLLVLGLAASIVHAVLIPIFSYIISKLLATFFDAANGTKDATRYSLWVIGIALVDALACYLMHLLLEYVGQAWVDVVRNRAMSRILDQPLDWFSLEENSVGQLTQSLDRNAEEMRNLLGRFAASMLVAFVLMAMSIIWSMAESWRLTLVGLSMAPVSLLITRSFQSVSAKSEAVCNDASDRSTGILSEAFTNLKTVRALTLESHFRRKHNASITSALKQGFRRAIWCGVFFGLSEALIIFTDALIFWYAAKLCAAGNNSVQNILTVLSLLLFSFSSVSATIAMIPQVSSSKDMAARLLELSRLPRTSHEHNGDNDPPESGDIACRDLTFAYPTKPDERILWKINQVFAHGISTAIVGPSGSGKSTIASLLLRLYATSLGATPQVTLNGVDINSIRTSALRNLITVVPQAPVLFPATIHENIAYGLSPSSPYATAENVKAAAASAGIASFINTLPDRYDTLIGDGGMGLSGGQAQRISIARALVRHPKVLLLDEATSALDPESANLVRDTVKSLIDEGGMTVIIITHTREMMEIADRVVMLERGEVVEVGGYCKLLGRGGKFAVMMSGGVWRGAREDEAVERNGREDDDGDEDRDGWGRRESDDEWDEVMFGDRGRPRFKSVGWE